MIRIDSLTKRYGSVVAVQDLDLEVERGQIAALLGPNGSGKSTTLKAVVGLVRPTSGAILIDGVDLGRERERVLSSLSYLPQRLGFPETLSGFEVLRFYARLRRLPPSSVAAAVDLVGLNGAFARPVGEYSGGMVQRLGLAVLSLPDVPVMLLDEPTAGLDPEGIRRFNDWLGAQRQRGKTILFTTHRLDDAEELADRAAILVQGRLVATMTAALLRAREVLEVWVRIANWEERFRQVAESLGAETLCFDPRGDYVYSARADRAAAVLEGLRSSGAEISRFTSRSSLERFYHRTTGGEE
jgi:Cu-processing system ATP-binding protein